MCGIVAYSSKEENFNLDKINFLMYCNSVERGGDATGIFSPTHGWFKSTKAIEKFLTEDNISKCQDKNFIGHLRSGTSGNATDIKNAHPFDFSNLIGVHNGTVPRVWDVFVKHGYKRNDASIDSEAIFRLINDKGPEIIKEIDGPMALVWWDKNEKALKIYRNSERPLFFGYFKDNLYISSIEDSLKVINCLSISEFDEDQLYTIKDGVISQTTVHLPRFKTPATSNPLEKFIGCYGRFRRYISSMNGAGSYHHQVFYKSVNNKLVLSDPDIDIKLNSQFTFFRLLDVKKFESINQIYCGVPTYEDYVFEMEIYVDGVFAGIRYTRNITSPGLCFISEYSMISKEKLFHGAFNITKLTSKSGKPILLSGDFITIKEFSKDQIVFDVSEVHNNIPVKVEYETADICNFIPIFNLTDYEEALKYITRANINSIIKREKEVEKENKEKEDPWIYTPLSEVMNIRTEVTKIFNELSSDLYITSDAEKFAELVEESNKKLKALLDEFETNVLNINQEEEEEEDVEEQSFEETVNLNTE
jgi:hypothetical protein